MKDSLPYAAMRTVRNILKFDQTYDETGICHVCGLFTWFRYRELFTKDAPLVAYDRDPQKSAIMINLLNTLDCSWCLSKFRVRAAAQEVLKQFEPVSIKNLVGELRLGTRTASILQTGVTGGVFTDAGIPGVTYTEFLPDVPRGEQRGNVRSENLEHLTFADGSFDLVISLDVFEHIYDPWQAFKEVYRVLRPGGCAVITVPMDKEKTETSRRYDSVTRTHLLPALYHLDPLQASGVLVVTDFGLDITTQLANYGIPASLMSYPTKYPECTQFVITIKKLRFSMPSISVAMATYNGAAFVEEQLNSIIAQDLPATEIICVDDGSTDGTIEIVRRIAERSPIPITIVAHQVNQGVTATFAHALSLVKGDFVALSDQDDVWLPGKLKILHEVIEEKQWDAIFSDANLVDQSLKPMGQLLLTNSRLEGRALKAALAGDLFAQLLRYNVVTGATLFFRASMLPKVLPIPGEWLHDYWVALIAAATGKIGLCNAPLVEYRQHGKNQIGMRHGFDREIQSAARKIHTAYLHERDLFRGLISRLEQLAVSKEVLERVACKAQFLESRYLLREKPLHRLPIVAENIFKFRYFKYGQGIKPLLKDLWLP